MRVFRFVVLVVAMVVTIAPTASAGGGSWLDTPDEYVEPGENVEFVGYVGAGNARQGPWHAFLNTGEAVVALGPVTIETTGLGGYLSHRVYLAFTVPSTLTTGSYGISVQNGTEYNENRTEFLGDLIGAVVEVGMVRTSSYYPWPIDEPLVASLPDHAVLAGGDWEITVGEVRRGIYPRCQWGCLIDPTVLRREDVTLIDAPPSWANPAPVTTTPAVTTTAPTAAITVGASPLATTGPIASGPTTDTVAATNPQNPGRDRLLIGAGVALAVLATFIAAARSRDGRATFEEERKILEDVPFEVSNV